MKKFLIAVLAFVSFAASAADLKFGNWRVPLDRDYAYTVNEQGGSITEFKMGLGWFSVLEYPNDTPGTSYQSEGETHFKMVWNVNGTNVKFKVSRDLQGWLKVTPETDKGRRFVMDQFWKSSNVRFISQENGATFVVSAKGVQSAMTAIYNRRAI